MRRMNAPLGGFELSLEDKRIALKIFVTICLISTLFFKPSPTFYRFVSLTKSLAYYGTTSIDQVHEETKLPFRDEIKIGGRTYININPGLSFFALASYVPYARLILPRLKQFSLWDPALDAWVAEFVMALSTVIFFTALLIAVFYLALRKAGCHRTKALFLSVLLYGGTPILFYSLNLSNGQNTLEMSLVFLAFFFLNVKSLGTFRAFLGGLFLGLAVFASITAVFLFLLFFLMLWKSKPQLSLACLAGVLLGSAPLLVYNYMSFGNPFLIAGYGLFRYVQHLSIGSILHQIWNFLLDPRVGLFPFSPFLIAVILFLKEIVAEKSKRLLLLSVLIYLICIVASFYTTLFAGSNHDKWYLLFGGGGCRYLLPIIPFLLYSLASVRLTLDWRGRITVAFIFLSFLINFPTLFWSGGPTWVFNHLLLFLKNGFHSYTIDLMKNLLALAGFNVENFSSFPIVVTFMFVLWWIWAGDRSIRGWLKGSKA